MRKEIDPEETGFVSVDKMVEVLANVAKESMNDDVLNEAFALFDSDNDGKINLEEFEFFMSGFARDMNKMRDSKMVKQMLETAKSKAGDDQLFEIKELVELLKGSY